MNSDQIARALQSTRDSRAIGKLRPEVTTRQAEIRARISAISHPNSSLIPTPVERQKAVLKGLESVAKLDKEIETLNSESEHLARLEQEIYAEFAAAEKREIAASIPSSINRLAGAKKRVREALKKLDDELAALEATVGPIGFYDELGMKFPLSDSEAADLHQLQREVWTRRKVMAVLPPGGLDMRGEFPLTFEQAFRELGGDTYQNRAPPRFVHPHNNGYIFFDEP